MVGIPYIHNLTNEFHTSATGFGTENCTQTILQKSASAYHQFRESNFGFINETGVSVWYSIRTLFTPCSKLALEILP